MFKYKNKKPKIIEYSQYFDEFSYWRLASTDLLTAASLSLVNHCANYNLTKLVSFNLLTLVRTIRQTFNQTGTLHPTAKFIE